MDITLLVLINIYTFLHVYRVVKSYMVVFRTLHNFHFWLINIVIFAYARSKQRMAENSRSSKLSSKDDECVFSWKLFTGWDYMIGAVTFASE